MSVATVFRPSLTMISAVADVLADSTVSETVHIDVRRHVVAADVCGVNRFNPYGLPDSRYRSVEASARFEGLLAQRLPAMVRGVCDRHLYFLFLSVAKQRCDVHGERVAAAAVASGFLSVDVHGTFPVHRPEMEQDVPAFIGFGKFERALIYESRLCVFFEIRIHNAGQGRLYGKGHQYLLVERRRR